MNTNYQKKTSLLKKGQFYLKDAGLKILTVNTFQEAN